MQKRIRLAQCAVIAMFVPAVTACGSSTSGAGSPSHGHLVVYERGGGLTGRTVTLTIAKSGQAATSPVNRSFRLTHQQLLKLRRLLDRSNFKRLPANSKPHSPVYDGYRYTIAYDGRTIHAQDGAIPPALVPALENLTQLVNGSQRP